MKNYITIIRKLDFIDLFKYGQFSINYAVPFDGVMLNHTNDEELFGALTSRMNMYEYSFEYIIVHFTTEDTNSQNFTIDIRNVNKVYTFDMEAKKEMSISFDERIELNVSPWSDKFEKLQQKLSIRQSMRGVDNLWSIFKLPEEDCGKCRAIITPEIVQEVFDELYANKRPSGDLSIWTYLLRYERHSFYPKGMLGIFCDLIHVFCNYTKKQELSGEIAESTELYHQLKACKSYQIKPLYEIVKNSRLSKMTETISGCEFVKAASLFLYLKAQFADGMIHKPDDKRISYSKTFGGFECSVAIYLLGMTLGYDKTYDAFYESAELPFFKKKEVITNTQSNGSMEGTSNRFHKDSEANSEISRPAVTNKVEIEEIKDEKADEDFIKNPVCKEPNVFDNESDSNNKHLPIMYMKKKAKGRIKADVRAVYDDLKLQEFSKKGYESVKRYDSTVKEAIKSLGFDPDAEKNRLQKTNK